MLTLLYSVGVIVLIISIIAGIYSGAFMGFLISVAGGIASAIIFFALAKILENQEAILHKLIHQEETQSKHQKQEKKICPRCNRVHDIDFSSCPHCGYRD